MTHHDVRRLLERIAVAGVERGIGVVRLEEPLHLGEQPLDVAGRDHVRVVHDLVDAQDSSDHSYHRVRLLWASHT